MTDIPLIGFVRPKVICVFRNGNRILVAEAIDPTTGQQFYCPPGGGIEFGETSEVALRREIMEELETQIQDPCLLGVLENIFIYNGRQGHEIIFVYDAQLADRSLYDLDRFVGIESGGDPFDLIWLDINNLAPLTPPVYPDGLLNLLKKEQL
jgi:8-oxo-dGTP pyrophosphatase MutT (NUDIX family)